MPMQIGMVSGGCIVRLTSQPVYWFWPVSSSLLLQLQLSARIRRRFLASARITSRFFATLAPLTFFPLTTTIFSILNAQETTYGMHVQ
ncbi:hypothetical protein PENSPDRAFT_168900 [Peniophora sp. CONT]|nr:hypothetical protein PENSPDRAFT_168900 [Peniophora sp. CONT]